MNLSELLPLHHRITPPERIRAFLEVLLLTGVVSSYLASVPFWLGAGRDTAWLQDATLVAGFVLLEAAITLCLLALLIRAHGGTIEDLGVRWKEWKTNALIGLSLLPLLFLLNLLVSEAFHTFLPKYFTERNPLTEIIRTPEELGLFIISVILAGGIKEELQRVFILTRFEHYLGGARLGLVLWSLAFGAAHYMQGVQATVIAALFGFIFGAVYLARENVIAPIVAHSLYDVLTLLGYWFTRTIPR
jgi:membrane protease YdiL (CAAX protease family)